MRTLTSKHLRKLFPRLSEKKAKEYAPHFSAAVVDAKINTRARLCAFVAQLAHESQDLGHLKEIWGPTPAQARYDVRTDLGNTPERDGDGKKYMGRGGIQRTGKHNYRRFEEATGIPVLDNPQLLEKPQHAFRSDALYWNDNKLNKIADRLTLRGDDKDLATFDRITKVINGGYNHRVDRQRRYLVAIATLPAELFEAEQVQPEQTISDSTAAVVTAQSNATEQPADETHKVLLQKLAAHEGAKNAAKSLGARMLRPAVVLGTALAAGNVYAWITVVLIAGAIAWYVIKNRTALWTRAQNLIRSFSK